MPNKKVLGNTGHVALVLDVGSIEHGVFEGNEVSYVPVYVMDSSSVYHFAPETFPPLSGQSYRNGTWKRVHTADA